MRTCWARHAGVVAACVAVRHAPQKGLLSYSTLPAACKGQQAALTACRACPAAADAPCAAHTRPRRIGQVGVHAALHATACTVLLVICRKCLQHPAPGPGALT